jgi:uncharacterized protein YutE (UPF0331/DUF86 family)
MEPEILLAKMESLSRCIHRVESRRPDTLEELIDNLDTQDIIVINLERAVQLCVDSGLHILSSESMSSVESMADVFLQLSLKKIIAEKLALNLISAVGFRKIAVHEYRAIDWNIVWAIINHNLQDFREFQKAVLDLV